jgi:hypothetical protein
VSMHGGDVRKRGGGAEEVKVESVHGRERRRRWRHLGLSLSKGNAGEV